MIPAACSVSKSSHTDFQKYYKLNILNTVKFRYMNIALVLEILNWVDEFITIYRELGMVA